MRCHKQILTAASAILSLLTACGTQGLPTPPSLELLDEATRHGLRVIVGVPWPQHIAFLDSHQTRSGIRSDVRGHVERLAAHPATLLFALGNEIPPGVVRWYGRRRIEGFLGELCDEARTASPHSLLTYVNYPPTEYLDTSCFDVCAFNVFLHREADLSAYLARLHNIAGPRPLLISEAGADSMRHGEERQSALVMMQEFPGAPMDAHWSTSTPIP